MDASGYYPKIFNIITDIFKLILKGIYLLWMMFYAESSKVLIQNLSLLLYGKITLV